MTHNTFFLTAQQPTIQRAPEQRSWNDVYGMEYFHWPACVSCLTVLPSSSCVSAY